MLRTIVMSTLVAFIVGSLLITPLGIFFGDAEPECTTTHGQETCMAGWDWPHPVLTAAAGSIALTSGIVTALIIRGWESDERHVS